MEGFCKLILEKRKRVTKGGKGRDKIGSVIGHCNGSRCAYHGEPGKKVWSI